jgi:predicted nucleotidyltransferase
VSKHLQSGEQLAISKFVDRLQQHYPERVYRTVLFGSKARGDSGPWSDIDILVVVDQDDWRFSHAISNLAADVSLEYDVLIGPRVIGQERWERMKRYRFSLYQNIIADGIPLTPASTRSRTAD